MTAYRDIYSDLPTRVHEVWQRTQAQTNSSQPDLSATAMLMAAAAGLAMPFENLKNQGIGNGEKWNEHPMFHSAKKSAYQAVLKSCDVFLKQPIKACDGLENGVLMQCQELKGIRGAATAGQGDAVMDIAKYDVRFAVKVLRNALAHNNILSIPDAGEIEKLAFFSISNWCPINSQGEGWNVLIIPVESFEVFLNKWFELLKPAGGMQGAALAVAGETLLDPQGVKND